MSLKFQAGITTQNNKPKGIFIIWSDESRSLLMELTIKETENLRNQLLELIEILKESERNDPN